ncbi:DUF441 domain-containing protein [Fuchsiella alkaliacetigena]|uniref:DUF441 domain-containing protein n=1 Tax=Fuchsiella alkaliacetigena TaxID=957042 RepID=UPI00200AE4C1|nr:DUF441 domain-containing protein [Fuchsiella alkaliacetigena]MCK8824612.1 DUF441 domain-containing protein [Fuchsiella alkaliacetigena]
MLRTKLVLFILLLLGVLSQNSSLLFSALILLVLRIFNLENSLTVIEEYSIQLGIILIMLGVLVPVATGQIDLLEIFATVKSPLGLIGLVMGVLVTQFTKEGIALLESTPEVIPNLVTGIIIGIAFFGGVPSGPLIAGGITGVLLKIFGT